MNTRRPGTPVTQIVAGVFLLGAALVATACGGPVRPDTAGPTSSVDSAVDDSMSTVGELDPDSHIGQPAVVPILVGVDLTDPVVAASGFVGMRDDWLYAANDVLEASLRHVITEEDYLELETQLLHEGLAPMRQALLEHPDLERTWFVTVPLTAEVLNQTETSARVEVWEVQIFSRVSITDPVSTWSIHTLDLTWADDRWQVATWKIEPGPTARIDSRQNATAADDFDEDLAGHGRLDDLFFDATRPAVSGGAES